MSDLAPIPAAFARGEAYARGEMLDTLREARLLLRALAAERDRYRDALQEIADIEGDQGPGRIAADALRASGIDPFSEAGKR